MEIKSGRKYLFKDDGSFDYIDQNILRCINGEVCIANEVENQDDNNEDEFLYDLVFEGDGCNIELFGISKTCLYEIE